MDVLLLALRGGRLFARGSGGGWHRPLIVHGVEQGACGLRPTYPGRRQLGGAAAIAYSMANNLCPLVTTGRRLQYQSRTKNKF